MERKHAIIVIKDETGRYLQYFDEIWNSWLFINCKIENELDFELIKQEILKKYNISLDNINLALDKVHSKFSQKDKIVKEYHHYFYVADLINENNLPANINFKYFTYEQLLQDKRIMEVNSDIVGFVKEIDC